MKKRLTIYYILVTIGIFHRSGHTPKGGASYSYGVDATNDVLAAASVSVDGGGGESGTIDELDNAPNTRTLDTCRSTCKRYYEADIDLRICAQTVSMAPRPAVYHACLHGIRQSHKTQCVPLCLAGGGGGRNVAVASDAFGACRRESKGRSPNHPYTWCRKGYDFTFHAMSYQFRMEQEETNAGFRLTSGAVEEDTEDNNIEMMNGDSVQETITQEEDEGHIEDDSIEIESPPNQMNDARKEALTKNHEKQKTKNAPPMYAFNESNDDSAELDRYKKKMQNVAIAHGEVLEVAQIIDPKKDQEAHQLKNTIDYFPKHIEEKVSNDHGEQEENITKEQDFKNENAGVLTNYIVDHYEHSSGKVDNSIQSDHL